MFKAINVLKKGLRINPNFINAKNNLANAYYQIERYDEALKIYKEILTIQPKHKDVNSNIALCYFYNKKFEETEKYFLITKNLDEENQNFQKNYAHYLLFKQNYKEAWNKYWDSRLRINDYHKSDTWKFKILKHVYTGNEIKKNDKILIIKEQGVGDEILYGTMYPDLIKKFPLCKIETDPRLISIFSRSYNSKSNFVPFLNITSTEKDFLNFDKIICAGSLGKFFRNNLNDFPYKNKLKANYQKTEVIKEYLNKLKFKKNIGISWKSKREFFGKGKSIDLLSFQNILSLENCNFINMQYGDTASDENELYKESNIKLTNIPNIDLMNDFENIASLLCSLDLFLTVSNSTAHLAGALNVPTILIKPKSFAIFHYWSQPNSKTPWYSSIELVDQENDLQQFMGKIKLKITQKLNL